MIKITVAGPRAAAASISTKIPPPEAVGLTQIDTADKCTVPKAIMVGTRA
jgi:hypothetical protein